MTVAATKPYRTVADIPCSALQGVGTAVAQKLQRLGLYTVQDILFHLPLRYEDRTQIYPIKSLKPTMSVCIEGKIVDIKRQFSGKTRLLIQLSDNTGTITLRFFHVNAIQLKNLLVGKQLRCFGEVRVGSTGLEIIHPEYCISALNEILPLEKTLTPIYPTTDGLHQLTLRKLTTYALQFLASYPLQELLPADILQPLHLPTLKQALQFIHRPIFNTDRHLLSQGTQPCQQRLAFEELVAHRLALLRLRQRDTIHAAPVLAPTTALPHRFIDALTFQLTSAQQRVIAEIQADLNTHKPMMRLVQGDVGSGKTIVAAYAMLQAVGNGYQAALMAPTDILAEQHYEKCLAWFTSLDIPVIFLSGKLAAKAKKTALNAIATQQSAVIIGTHALFQPDVCFNRLALIVIDEQHRFGVHQRLSLREKGINHSDYPHQLIMTATPIPRTLAMTAYADLDTSVIDELPPGRQPIATKVINNRRKTEIIQYVGKECQQGAQVYWVCTLIEESEVLQCQAAEERAKELKEYFPELSIALIHSRIKTQDKQALMSAFARQEIAILVATTVIEVGVDVPNASIMVIENAERLGLAQLHQLRGRVGRGAKSSSCMLLYQEPLSFLAQQRLSILREHQDGFIVAEKDLELRGPGELLGTRQTGLIQFRIADLLRDRRLLQTVSDAVATLQKSHPACIEPLIKRWLKEAEQFSSV